MGDIFLAATSPLAINCDFHNVDSRPSSPNPISVAAGDRVDGTLDESTSVKAVPLGADPDAKLKFDIRAQSAIVRTNLQKAETEQKSSGAQSQAAEGSFGQTPVFLRWGILPFYNFTQRTQLYNASVKAQIKFSKSTSIVRLEQMHVAYLEALSKSSLSPEEQHAAYSKFKITLADACQKRVNADIEEERSVGCSPNVRKYFAPKDAALKTEATDAEKEVRNLLKEIQQPYTELRNNIAANLHYRDVQLFNPEKTEDERATLKSDISVIRSFQATGGLDSLSEEESKNINTLFKDATIKYNTFQKEATAFKKATSTTNTTSLHEASLAFQQADAAVIAKIRELSVNLKVPPQLRKDLTAHLKHKEVLQASATGDEAAKLNEEIATLKAFLNSRQLAALNSKTAEPLTDLFREADKQYANWQRLETAAKDLDAAAQKASTEPLAPEPKAAPKAAPTVVVPIQQAVDALAEPSSTAISTAAPKAPTKEEEAQTKAKQLKMEAHKVLVDKATQARADATQAKRDLDKADKAIMDKIETLLSREMSKMLPSKKDPSNIGRIDTDDDEIEEANLNLSSSPIQEMRELHPKKR